MKLSIEKHLKAHEDLIKILDMLQLNRRYMFSDISDLSKKLYTDFYPRNYFEKRIEMRKKIQARLLTYYAKKVAMIGSDAYNVAMDILKPISSN